MKNYHNNERSNIEVSTTDKCCEELLPLWNSYNTKTRQGDKLTLPQQTRKDIRWQGTCINNSNNLTDDLKHTRKRKMSNQESSQSLIVQHSVQKNLKTCWPNSMERTTLQLLRRHSCKEPIKNQESMLPLHSQDTVATPIKNMDRQALLTTRRLTMLVRYRQKRDELKRQDQRVYWWRHAADNKDMEGRPTQWSVTRVKQGLMVTVKMWRPCQIRTEEQRQQGTKSKDESDRRASNVG